MATTSMDYENANGDRFDGKFWLSFPSLSQPYESRADSLCLPTCLRDWCAQTRERVDSPNSQKTQASLTFRNIDETTRYERDRSASPRRDDGHESRRRSMSPNGNDRYVFNHQPAYCNQFTMKNITLITDTHIQCSR